MIRTESILHIPWFLSSRTRLFLVLVVTLGVPCAIGTLVVLSVAGGALERQAVQQNRSASALAAHVLEAQFDDLARSVDSFAARPLLVAAVAEGDADAVRRHLQELVRINPNFDRVFVADAAGVLRHDWPLAPETTGRDFSHRDWYRGVTASKAVYVSEVYQRAAPPKKYLVAVAAPVGVAETPAGYLVAQYTIESLTTRLEGVRPAASGSLLVVDHRGRLAAQRSPDEAPKELGGNGLLGRLRDGEAVEAEHPLTGVPSLISAAKVARRGWVVIAEQPVAEVFRPMRVMQGVVGGVAFVSFLLVLGLGFAWLDAIRRHHEEIVTLQQAKEMLSGMIIHDVRNPLTATLGWLDLLEAGEGVDAKEAVREARGAAQALLALINVLMDIMRMEDGKLPLARKEEDLAALVQERVARYGGMAGARKAGLKAVVPGGRVAATVDAEVMGRVIENLMTNAIKHTGPGGEVVVEVSERAGVVEIAVRDTGEGIPPEYLPKLFKKYGRVELQKLGFKYDTGFGLVFARMATEAHGGTIGVESEVGKGSVFRVRLPK